MVKSDKSKPEPKKPAGRVFDVSRPGKTLASPTSRPIISGHKASAQSAQVAVSGIGEGERPIMVKRKIEITPSGDVQVEPPKATPEQPVPEAANEPAQEAPAPAQESEPSQEGAPELPTTTPDEPKTSPETSEPSEPQQGPTVERPLPEKEAPKEPEEPRLEHKATIMPPGEADKEAAPSEEAAATEPAAPEEAAPEKATLIPDIPTEKPIGQTVDGEKQAAEPAPEPNIKPIFNDSGVIVSHHNHRKGHGLKVFFMILLILALAAAALDIALDLELLNLPTVPHTDFL